MQSSLTKSPQHNFARRSANVPTAIGCIAFSLLLNGCASLAQPSAASQGSAAPAERPSPLSYGAITSTVEKGVTTQSDLIELFGGPNIATKDSDGTETWVYERTSSETTATNQATTHTEAQRLDVFFGLGFVRKGAGVKQSSGRRTVSHSIRSLTVIIKFNPDNTVKDYSARASYF